MSIAEDLINFLFYFLFSNLELAEYPGGFFGEFFKVRYSNISTDIFVFLSDTRKMSGFPKSLSCVVIQ